MAADAIHRFSLVYSQNGLTLTALPRAGVGGSGIGGAVSAYNMTEVMTFSSDTFRNNSAAAQGGILAVTSSPTFAVTIANSTVADNTVRH